jgi:threonine dehydrogenase-like Zn-dependent dehydrogenase
MLAAVTTQYGKIDWQEMPEPQIAPNQVLVKVGSASICGSDEHIFRGDFHPRTNTPLIQGHEFMGRVVETGSEITRFKSWDRVAIDPIIWCGECPACKMGHYPACTRLKLIGVDMNGGFGEYVAVAEHMCFPLYDNIPDQHGALVEVYGIGFHASKRAKLKAGDSVAIYGTGKVGHCVYQAARTITDNTIFLVDVIGSRLKLATDNYKNVVTIDSTKQDPVKVIQEHTHGAGVDVAFEVVGHAHPVKDRHHPVRSCIQSIHGAGVVCVLGLADDPAPLNMKELIWREASIVASRVSHGEMKDAIEHLHQGNLQPEVIISAEIHPSQTGDAFGWLEKEPDRFLKVIMNFE